MPATIIGHKFHNELLEHLERVGQWWPDTSERTVSAINAREVLVQLTDLRDVLQTHFAAEEEHGLLPEGTPSDPRATDKEADLLKQHAGLLQQIESTIVSVPATSTNPTAWKVARSHFKDFRKALESHEHAEIELLRAESGDSLGVGD